MDQILARQLAVTACRIQEFRKELQVILHRIMLTSHSPYPATAVLPKAEPS
jgi:hypothetical protein